MKSLYRKVDSFDGQIITIDGKHCYELGAFLGGGAAGVVYEGANISDKLVVRPVAIKILNPVGFRLAPAVTLRRCLVAKRGQPVGGSATSESGSSPSGFMGGAGGMETGLPGGSTCSGRPGLAGGVHGGGATNSRASKLGPENVWWLVSPNTKQVIAAYVDPRYGNLVELPLTKCIQIWGLNPNMEGSASCGSPNRETRGSAERKERDDNAGVGAEADGPSADASWGSEGFEVQVDGIGVCIPWLPPKYVQWLAQRRKVKREINNMSKVGGHRNVVKLLSVLELIQDSKSTLFLILELVTGGELLDHIRLLGDKSSRAREASALRADGSTQHYFRQLLSGLAYCHRQGICHRDLSPSNLLLAESPQRDARLVLKIADFGLSACCAGNENQNAASSRRGLPQRVKSIVGSPHYMAPEVNSSNVKGYDGFKADAWSCGVVLFTMLTASLPFDRDLTRCPRFKRFKHWANKHSIGIAPSRATSAVTGVASEGALSPTSYSPPPSSSLSTSLAPSASSGSAAATPAPSSPPAPPAWLFPSSIHPTARSLLVSLLVPNPSRRMSVEQALNHPWLTGGWTGDAMGNDGVSSGPDPAVAGGAAASMTPKDGPPSPSSRVVTSSTAGSKGDALIGEDAGVHHPGADGYHETVNRRQNDVLGSRWEGDNWGMRHGAQGQDTRRVREERVGQKGSGNVGGGRVGGWRGWTADITHEELLSLGSLPSTSSYP